MANFVLPLSRKLFQLLCNINFYKNKNAKGQRKKNEVLTFNIKFLVSAFYLKKLRGKSRAEEIYIKQSSYC